MVAEIFCTWLYQCQNPGYEIVPSFCKVLLLGEPRNEYVGSPCIVSYHCTWTYNYLKIKKLTENIQKKRLSRNTHFSFSFWCQYGSAQRHLSLAGVPSCLFSLTRPTQNEGTWSDCRMDYLKTGLSWENRALNSPSLPTPLLFSITVFQDLDPWKVALKAQGSLPLGSASLSKVPGFLMSHSPRMLVSMPIPGIPKGVEF